MRVKKGEGFCFYRQLRIVYDLALMEYFVFQMSCPKKTNPDFPFCCLHFIDTIDTDVGIAAISGPFLNQPNHSFFGQLCLPFCCDVMDAKYKMNHTIRLWQLCYEANDFYLT